VVGVIANLAVFFAYHVFWPRGGPNDFEWPAALIALAAGIALFQLPTGVIPIIAGCAAAGLVTLGLRRRGDSSVKCIGGSARAESLGSRQLRVDRRLSRRSLNAPVAADRGRCPVAKRQMRIEGGACRV